MSETPLDPGEIINTKKHSDIAFLYCEDPKNDPSGGWKERMRTLNKSYRPDVPNLTNAWHVVSDENGQGTYKVQQKNLTKINGNCLMLVGENVGEDQWTSAKMTVAQYLNMNSFVLPDIGDITFVDMNPYRPPYGAPVSHITDESGVGWAFPGETLKIMCAWSEKFFKLDDLIFQWSVNQGNATITANHDKADPSIEFTGPSGDFAQIGLKITAKDDPNIWKSARLMILGQSSANKLKGAAER
jgi:hypothetical protein